MPIFAVTRSSVVRVHLGFAAKSVAVSIDQKRIVVKLDSTKRTVSWVAARGGILTVSAQAAGSASYVAHLRVA